MEIGVLVLHPGEEAGDLGVGAQRLGRRIAALELLVRQDRVDRAVADGVHRLGLASAAAPGNRMVPFDAPTQQAAAEEAGLAGQRFSQWRLAKKPKTTDATTRQKMVMPQKDQWLWS